MFFGVQEIKGQIPNRRPTFEGENVDDTQELTPKDTTPVLYFKFDDINKIHRFNDTINDTFFPMYDPSRRRWDESFNLGNTGSASFPIISRKSYNLGTNYGYRTYEDYKMEYEDFTFYDAENPILDFYFTPVGGQQNFVIRSNFARTFSGGVKMSINYDRIKQDGFYQEQNLKHTNFGISIWKRAKEGNRDLFLTFLNSVQSEDQSGGVSSRISLFEPFGNRRETIDVTLDGADTRLQHHKYMAQHHLRYESKEGSGIEFISKIGLFRGYYKYSDPSVSSSQGFYGIFYQDDRGLRNYLGYTTYHLLQEIKGSYKNIEGSIGIENNIHRIDYEAFNSTRNDLFLYSKAIIPINENIAIDGHAKFGLAKAGGDFFMKAKTLINLGNFSLEGNAEFYRHQNPLQSENLILNGNEFWDQELSKPFGSQFSARLKLPILNAYIGIRQQLEENTLFYNESVMPETNSDLYSVTISDIFLAANWWKLNIEGYGAYQVFNNNLFNLPAWYTKYNVYLKTSPFEKRINIRIGVEGKATAPHNPINFNPLLSVFYADNNLLNSNDILSYNDFYVSARIQKFRIFIRYENLRNAFSNYVYFQIADYPQQDNKLRFGIAWTFID